MKSACWMLVAGATLCACSAGDERGTEIRRGSDEPVVGLTEPTTNVSPNAPAGQATNAELLPAGLDPQTDPNCGLVTFDVERRPVDVLLVLDRSASMRDAPDGATTTTSKWDLTVPALTQVVAESNAGVSWGMKVYPEGQDTDSCSAATITDTIHVPIAVNNAQVVVDAILNKTTPDGDGTPTGDAIRAATRYLAAQQTQNKRYILLATDGEPSCSPSGEGGESARPYAVSAVAEAASQGFPVFVVGVATTKDSATEALNDMALAGGVPRPDPNPLATRYYLANTQTELATALRAITSAIASCVFPLSTPPPVPNNIGIKVDGVLVPRDGQNGWEYSGPDLSAVEVHGPACDQIQATARDVQVIYACEGVIIR